MPDWLHTDWFPTFITLLPQALPWLGLALLLLLWSGLRSKKLLAVASFRKLALVSLRFLSMSALLLALLIPILQSNTQAPPRMAVLIDLSPSLTDSELQTLKSKLLETLAAKPEAEIVLLSYDGNTRIIHDRILASELSSSLRRAATLREILQRDSLPSQTTNTLSEAIHFAASTALLQDAEGLLVLSDGRVTQPVNTHTELPHWIQIAQSPQEPVDVSVLNMIPPPSQAIQENEALQWQTTIHIPDGHHADMKWTLQRGEELIWTKSQTVFADEKRLTVTCPGLTPGSYEMQVMLDHESDTQRSNNIITRTFTVQGPESILIVHGDDKAHTNIQEALQSTGHTVELISLSDMQTDWQPLRRYPFAWFTAVKPTDLTTENWLAVRAIVEHAGVGLAVIAGEGWADLELASLHSVNTVLPVSLTDPAPKPPQDQPLDLDRGPEAEPIQEPEPKDQGTELARDDDGPIQQNVLTPSVTAILLIDRSGSMALDNRLDIAKASAIATSEAMDDNDLLGVCAFDVEPHWIFRPTKATNRSYIIDSLRRLRPGGGTALYPSLLSASKEILRVKSNVKHVIILSDGLTQDADFEKLIRIMVKNHITVSSVFIGEEEGALRMARMAKWGKGNYYPTTDLSEVPRIFTHDLSRRIREYEVKNPRKPNPNDPPPDISKPPVDEPTPISSEDLLADPPLDTEPQQPREPQAQALVMKDLSLATRNLSTDAMPTVFQWIHSSIKPSARTAIETVQSQQPVLAEWQLGLGRVAFLSTDVFRWGSELADWVEFPHLIAQMVQSGMRHTTTGNTQMEDLWQRHGNRVNLSLLTYDVMGQPMTDLRSEVTLTGDDGIPHQQTMHKQGDAAMATEIPLPAGRGEYRIDVRQFQGERLLHSSHRTLYADPDRETRSRYTYTDPQRMFPQQAGWQQRQSGKEWTTLTGAQLLQSQSLDFLFLLIALALFPFEILLRRLWL